MVQTLDYQLYMRWMISETPIKHTEIFFFENEGLKKELVAKFQKLFNLYQGSLNRQGKYGIKKATIFFNHNHSVNAKATVFNDHYLISINKGTICTLWKKFYLKSDLMKLEGLDKFDKVQSNAGYPINKLMFQLCCHFSFYHELAHLIQKSDYLTVGLSEDVTSSTNFNLERHVLEYDADAFSAVSLGTHLYQYIRDWCPNLKNGDAELIISVVASSIFVYLMLFESAKIPFYTKLDSHLHPFVRLLGIVHYMTDYIKHLDATHGVLNLDSSIINSEMMVCSKLISNELLDDQALTHLKVFFKKNTTDARNYNIELLELVSTNIDLAFNKRNIIAN